MVFRGEGKAYINTTAVIRDLKQLETAFFDDHFERCRARVHSVLHKLFEGVNGRDNYLSCRNLVHDVWIQSLSETLVSCTNIPSRCMGVVGSHHYSSGCLRFAMAVVTSLTLGAPWHVDIHLVRHRETRKGRSFKLPVCPQRVSTGAWN